MDGNGSGSPEEWPFDDFLGERKVVELTPTADTSTRNFVPSSAASLTENYPMVDESAVDDDTTYNSSSTINDEDRFVFSNLLADITSVEAVSINVNWR